MIVCRTKGGRRDYGVHHSVRCFTSCGAEESSQTQEESLYPRRADMAAHRVAPRIVEPVLRPFGLAGLVCFRA